MSSEVVIEVENLSKGYPIYRQPRDRLKQMIIPRLQRIIGLKQTQYFQEFRALNEVSFEITQGETVGIIGRNGSGKSTLLQLICGTLNPSRGKVQTKGRIAALLELGSGFNPELTGRENIYINAAVLGLGRNEIEKQFQCIVAFADIGEFIYRPLKIYSSGMMMRLAFSVAIHVEPDILVVDEALSVGDIAFRNKCMERIHKMVAQGVTILFVTHDLSTLQLLCSRVVWLDRGSVVAIGNPVRISQDYYIQTMGLGTAGIISPDKIPSQQETGKALFTQMRLFGGDGKYFLPGQSMRIVFSLIARENLGNVVFAISIYRADGDWVIGQTSLETGVVWPAAKAREIRKGALHFESLCLAPGDYFVALGAYSEDYSLCYALTDLSLNFSVRARYPTWGKFIHPCRWLIDEV